MTGQLTQLLRNRSGKEMNYASYTDNGRHIHQLWYIEDGAKYGQEYYSEDGNAVDLDRVLDEVDSFPEVPAGTEFPRKQQ